MPSAEGATVWATDKDVALLEGIPKAKKRKLDVLSSKAVAAFAESGDLTEAMRSVVGYAATLGLRRLSARTHLGNLRSDALLEKLGFEEEGLLRGHVLRDGEHRDCRLFGLLL